MREKERKRSPEKDPGDGEAERADLVAMATKSGEDLQVLRSLSDDQNEGGTSSGTASTEILCPGTAY